MGVATTRKSNPHWMWPAPGDTLLLGLGRFTETHVVEAPYDTGDVYVEVSTDSISIIGSGADVTIIGSENADKRSDHWPKGVLGWPGIEGFRIMDLTIENMRDGMFLNSGISMLRCELLGNVDAIVIEPNGEAALFEEIVFEGNEDDAIIAFGPCPLFVVKECIFNDNHTGVNVVSIDSVRVSDCIFDGHWVSVQIDHCPAEICNCTFTDGYSLDVWTIGSHLLLNDCRFSSADTAIYANTVGYLIGQGNVIPSGEGERILIDGTAFYFNNNHIIRGEGLCVKLMPYSTPAPLALDFTNNYWGTTEADSIAAWIWDENDDSNVEGEVIFEPFSPVPLPDEKKSLGDVKRMFR